MNWSEFKAAFNNLKDQQLKMMEGKSRDYAGNIDSFANFRVAATTTRLTPEQIMLVMVSIKLARLATLLSSGKDPVNEPVSDSAIDQANYAHILSIFAETLNLTPQILNTCVQLSNDADLLALFFNLERQ